jgi:hypothetical protein
VKKRKIVPKPKKQFCPKGHDTFIVGRYATNGCKQCDKERVRIYPVQELIKIQFCPNGHNTFICGRTTKRGSCKECVKESRKRDKKRNRFILSIGCFEWHISQKEALRLKRQLAKINITK